MTAKKGKNHFMGRPPLITGKPPEFTINIPRGKPRKAKPGKKVELNPVV